MEANMIYTDKKLMCQDCSVDFTFTAGEQDFFTALGLCHEPRRCNACRIIRRFERDGKAGIVRQVRCAECGAETVVPFAPKGRKPVYCPPCLRKNRVAALEALLGFVS